MENGDCSENLGGRACNTSCPKGEVCYSGACTPAATVPCPHSSDCPGGYECISGYCLPATSILPCTGPEGYCPTDTCITNTSTGVSGCCPSGTTPALVCNDANCTTPNITCCDNAEKGCGDKLCCPEGVPCIDGGC